MGISEVKQVKLLAKLLFKLFDDSYEFHLLQLFKRMLLSPLCCNSLNLSLTRNSSLRFYFVSLIFFFLLNIRFFNKNNAPNYFLFVFLSYFTLTLTAYALALEFFFSLLFCVYRYAARVISSVWKYKNLIDRYVNQQTFKLTT